MKHYGTPTTAACSLSDLSRSLMEFHKLPLSMSSMCFIYSHSENLWRKYQLRGISAAVTSVSAEAGEGFLPLQARSWIQYDPRVLGTVEGIMSAGGRR